MLCFKREISEAGFEVKEEAGGSADEVELGGHDHGTGIGGSVRSGTGLEDEGERGAGVVGLVGDFERRTGVEEGGELQSEFLGVAGGYSGLERKTKDVERDFGSDERLLLVAEFERGLHSWDLGDYH